MVEEAFAAKHLPDMGYDVKDFKVFTWKLGSWKKLDKKLTSPDFECGGHKWCVILPFLLLIFRHSYCQAYTPLSFRQFECASERYRICISRLCGA